MDNHLRQEILSRVNFLEEYQRIGIRFASEVPTDKNWIPCHSIDRDDRNPSAAINLENGYYIDLGSGGRRLSFYDLMQIAGGFSSYRDVLEHYASRLNLPFSKVGRPQKTPEKAVDFLPWNGNGDRWCAQKSTNQNAVFLAGGDLCRYHKMHLCIGFRVYNSIDISHDPPTGYVVSQTNGIPLPVMDKSGKVVGNTKIKTVAGTISGLIGQHALTTIHAARQAGELDSLLVIKTEGVTDMTALLARIPETHWGRFLVLTNSGGCSEKPKQQWADAFAGLSVAVVHDCDQPGQRGAEIWCQWLQGIAREVRNVVLPYEISENHGKDLKDYFQEGKTAEDFFQMVSATPKVEMKQTTIQEMNADNPHRLAKLFLNRHFAIEGEEDYWTLIYRQGWYRWKQGAYGSILQETVQVEITQFCNQQFVEDWEAEYNAWKTTGEGSQPKVRKVTLSLIANILNVVKSMVYIDCEEERFWRYGHNETERSELGQLIPCQNGIIHVGRLVAGREDYFLPATPALFTCNVIPSDYQPDAYSKVWVDMITQNLAVPDEQGGWDVSRQRMLQEFFGYCLIPSNELQKFMILEGEGSNGKSAVLCGFSTMLGSRNISNVSLDLFGDKFAMNTLRGKLVNLVDDLTETDRICEGRLKSIVSGAEIGTDRKNQEGISFTPFARLIFSTNNRPRFNDRSSGIQRRLEIIPFTNQVHEDDKRPEFCDHQFWEKHKSGILNWCLQGLVRLRKHRMRLTVCAASEAAKKEYMYEINPALAFFDECLQESETGFVVSADLYRIYTEWCDKNGTKRLNNINLFKELKRKYKNAQRSRQWISSATRGYVYTGIILKEDSPKEELPF